MSDTGFVSHCLELLSPLGSTSSRRMFGGHALYIDGLCMALIISDTLYLKVDDASRAVFERGYQMTVLDIVAKRLQPDLGGLEHDLRRTQQPGGVVDDADGGQRRRLRSPRHPSSAASWNPKRLALKLCGWGR